MPSITGTVTPTCSRFIQRLTKAHRDLIHDRFWDRLVFSNPKVPEDPWAQQLFGQIIGPRDHMNVHVRTVRMLGELDDLGLPASDRPVNCP